MMRLIDLSSQEIAYSTKYLQYMLVDSRKNPKRKVLVNGSPKTGTTWMLKMIQSIPGYHEVGNFDGDIARYHTVQAGDVVHGHDFLSPELAEILEKNTIKVVLMIRDPRDQLISRVFHIRRVQDHAWHERLKAVGMDEAIMLCIEGGDGLPGTRTMIELTQTWLDNRIKIVWVRYEELLAETVKEFQRVVDYLGIQMSDALLESIVARNQFERLASGKKFWKETRKQGQADPNSHFRKGITGDWQNYFNKAHKELFKQQAGDKLIELGYEKDLNW
jgi:hypothetical protein